MEENKEENINIDNTEENSKEEKDEFSGVKSGELSESIENALLENSENQSDKKNCDVEICDVLSDDETIQKPDKLVTVRPVKFQEFSEIKANRAIKKNLDILQNISMHVSVELGKTKSSIREVMDMEKGSVVELNKIAGEQVEIYVNDKLVAKGEVIVIEDKFGVRVTSTSLPKDSL